jgi:hypothetical protein
MQTDMLNIMTVRKALILQQVDLVDADVFY